MSPPESNSISVICDHILSLLREKDGTCCVLANHAKVLLSRTLASQVAIGDKITFAIPDEKATGAEVLVTKHSGSWTGASLYLAPIRYATRPIINGRGQSFVCTQVRNPNLGIFRVFLPCALLRDYFFSGHSAHPTLYDILRVRTSASPAEMRIAFKLRTLELNANGVDRSEHINLERAFNILGNPELRAHYDGLVADSEIPAIFPYGGVGSLLVAGQCSRNGEAFFARRILSFVPDQLQRRFHLQLRHCDFYADKALCRDARRTFQFWLDPDLIHATWGPSWNRWKHLLSTKIEVQGAFVRGGSYEKRGSDWKFMDCETGLPSRLSVKLPKDFAQDIKTAQNTYCRFGQYSRAFDQIRLCLEHKAIERKDLERMCSELGIPGDFDVAQISWRPDYDTFYYRELSQRARRLYLFRREYIFELEKVVVVETPQLGHATYVFAKPRNMGNFLAQYANATKTGLRRNRDNISNCMGFQCRVVHGSSPGSWLKEIKRHSDI